jgi:ABC-type multidrug transport system ATPase subunit
MEASPAIDIHQLRFGFPKQPLLFEDLALRIPQGTVFGILGPNGAGKSTLIKIILGLIPRYTGTVQLFGQTHAAHRQAILERVGFLLEGPRVYAHLSGLDNLKLWTTYRGLDPERPQALLKEVGLVVHAHKLVRHYSTGLRQRLAIALALLHNPDLLILDEPTNGLDPQGIAEIRQLIRQLQTEPGRTIILCSHLLSEVQQVCEEVGILHQGQVVFQGKVQDLQRASQQYVLEVDQVTLATAVLQGHSEWLVTNRRTDLLVDLPNREAVDLLIGLLRDAGIRIYQVRRQEDELEHTYLQVVK